jgi:hypothetical protein
MINKTFVSSVCTLSGRPGTWEVKPRTPGGDQPGVDRLVDRKGAKFQCNQRFRRYRACCLCS